MSHNIYQDDTEFSNINIVPFVDVILVVLIIFMVTTPFIVKPSISVKLPTASSAKDSKPSKLTITVKSRGEIYIGKTRVSIGNLKQRVKSLAQQSSETQAIIDSDKSVSHGVFVEVLDQVKRAGVKRLAISTEKNK